MKNFVVFKNLLFFFGELFVSSYPWVASTVVKILFGWIFNILFLASSYLQVL